MVNLVNLVNLHLESSSHIPCRIVQAADRVSGQGGGPEDGAGEARGNVEFGITHYDTSWHIMTHEEKWNSHETIMKQSWNYKTIKAKEHVGHIPFFSFKARFDQWWPMFPGTCIHAVHAQFPDLHDLGLNQLENGWEWLIRQEPTRVPMVRVSQMAQLNPLIIVGPCDGLTAVQSWNLHRQRFKQYDS